jgi:hypothetical protein
MGRLCAECGRTYAAGCCSRRAQAVRGVGADGGEHVEGGVAGGGVAVHTRRDGEQLVQCRVAQHRGLQSRRDPCVCTHVSSTACVSSLSSAREMMVPCDQWLQTPVVALRVDPLHPLVW